MIDLDDAMTLPDELERITALTLADYDQTAERFREGTRDHDVSQNIEALLRHLEGQAPQRILDFGCGPGPENVHASGALSRGRRRVCRVRGHGPR